MQATLKACLREGAQKIPGRDGKILWIKNALRAVNDLSYITNIFSHLSRLFKYNAGRSNKEKKPQSSFKAKFKRVEFIDIQRAIKN